MIPKSSLEDLQLPSLQPNTKSVENYIYTKVYDRLDVTGAQEVSPVKLDLRRRLAQRVAKQ